MSSLSIAFFGSSLISAYWNGAATYFRGVIRQLHLQGHRVTFYESDAFDRQAHRDIDDPDYARSVVYSWDDDSVLHALAEASEADVVIKASGVGLNDALLEREVLALQGPRACFFWDVDAPATLERLSQDADDPFHRLIPEYDGILTYGGGDPVVEAYCLRGARQCVPIYNALDPDTHHPVPPQEKYRTSLALAANRLPDREARIQEFFFTAAQQAPDESFLLAGNGWQENVPDLPNVRRLGHLYTWDHNAFNCSARAVLNVCRESMAQTGFSPPTRVFEAVGAGACLITDAWEGVELFLEPEQECLVARNGAEVAALLHDLSPELAQRIGERGRDRLLREHTYAHRADLVQEVLRAAVEGRQLSSTR